MKKASAKIRRKVKTKFCRELASMNQKLSNYSSKSSSARSDRSKSAKEK